MTAPEARGAGASGGLLSGVRILDFTSVLLGPYCTRTLAQYGADVVKIESPDGDISRRLGLGKSEGMSSSHLQVNKGKRSIALDLKRPESVPVVQRMVEWADVVVLNLRADAAARLGLDYDSVRAHNPNVVYCRTPGFGSGGAYAGLKAYDDVIQSASGLASLQTQIAGKPQYIGGAIADKVVGLVAASAILSGLVQRGRTGRGVNLEVPMLETMVDYFLLENLGGMAYVPSIGAPLYARTASPTRRPFATADGHMSAVVYSDRDWHRLLTHSGHDGLIGDPRLATITDRTENTDFAYGVLGEIFAGRTTAEWLTILREMDIAVMPMNSVDELFTDPHLVQVGMFDEVEHPTEGTIRAIRSGVTVDGAGVDNGLHAPLLGEHTLSILTDCGFSRDEAQALLSTGVVEQAETDVAVATPVARAEHK
ncbi:CaiB/BaiF CoA transferase family protein [Rhodococcus sp. NM-2]|uniref:CaiB/BaiF CoA transferase family protein n=1 Tax=Rhodococcus sp. NM-2 TaxID=3401174 RepID=UPI003AAB38AE